MRRILVCAVLCGSFGWQSLAAQAPNSSAALEDIVGVWQSDTTGGTWALSTCARSPQGGAVICEQTITTPAGVRHAVNVFAVDSAAGRYVYYGITQPGAPVRAVPLAIAGHVWTYGGLQAAPDGTWYRTINDFSTGPDAYTWRGESSRDGVQWTETAHGRSVRQRQ